MTGGSTKRYGDQHMKTVWWCILIVCVMTVSAFAQAPLLSSDEESFLIGAFGVMGGGNSSVGLEIGGSRYGKIDFSTGISTLNDSRKNGYAIGFDIGFYPARTPDSASGNMSLGLTGGFSTATKNSGPNVILLGGGLFFGSTRTNNTMVLVGLKLNYAAYDRRAEDKIFPDLSVSFNTRTEGALTSFSTSISQIDDVTFICFDICVSLISQRNSAS